MAGEEVMKMLTEERHQAILARLEQEEIVKVS